MTEPDISEPDAARSEMYDTGGQLDSAHDPAASDGPHLDAAATERDPDSEADSGSGALPPVDK